MTVDGHTLRFSYDSGKPMFIKYDSTTFQYVLNLQGDVIAIVNSEGAVVVEYAYDAWGNVLSVTGSHAFTLGYYNPLRYRGYVYDYESGLYYLQSRYYNPTWGRFLNADSFVSTGQGLLGNNMFAYCNNNPVRYIDNYGETPIDPSGDLGGWFGELIGKLIYDSIDESDRKTLHQIGSAATKNIEASAGIGLGHYGEITLCKEFSVTAGMKYDVFAVCYSDGQWSTQEQCATGFEIAVKGFPPVGYSEDAIRPSGAKMWESPPEQPTASIFGFGGYLFGGFSISIGYDVIGFFDDLYAILRT